MVNDGECNCHGTEAVYNLMICIFLPNIVLLRNHWCGGLPKGFQLQILNFKLFNFVVHRFSPLLVWSFYNAACGWKSQWKLLFLIKIPKASLHSLYNLMLVSLGSESSKEDIISIRAKADLRQMHVKCTLERNLKHPASVHSCLWHAQKIVHSVNLQCPPHPSAKKSPSPQRHNNSAPRPKALENTWPI